MAPETFRFASRVDGFPLQGYRWPAAPARARVVIAHGAAEHSLRYDRFARALTAAAFDVWSLDHRGHGQSPGPDGLGDFGQGGWDALVADIAQLVEQARGAGDRPVILFGHSMGSFAAQQLILDRSSEIDALVLSGSGAREPAAPGAPPPPGPNAAFEPARTPYDWLSRDEAEVDRYIADPLCGFESQRVTRGSGARVDFSRLAAPALLAAIRSDLPMLFVSGDRDPIGRNLEGLRLLEQRYRDAGVARIDTQYYAGGRHEMLNETNRDEVTANILAWLDAVVPAAKPV